ncbi:MAG: Holliday junction resolvase RuvX [Clostridia bacterium]|nr:Holliday junction resolvase RuvX [Clostridia bacterium]
MIIFSVDYGDARTGMAVCDKNEILSSPLGVISESWAPKVIKALNKKIKDSGAQLIVVGNPINMDGTRGERSVKCAEFASQLEKESGVPVVLWDERLTTVSAHKALNTVDVRGTKRKNIVDAVSAVMILDDYISYRKNNK